MTPEKIILKNGKLIVPENPVIPFIEGNGTGTDIWKASVRVFEAAVEKEFRLTGNRLPDQTLTDFRDSIISNL